MEGACTGFGAGDVHSFHGKMTARRNGESDRVIRKLVIEGPSKTWFRTGKKLGCLRLFHS